MTSEVEKTVHQQSIMTVDAALDFADKRRGHIVVMQTTEGLVPTEDTVSPVLATRRLREENEKLHERTSIALGVGDGSGQKFVYGNSESIDAAQKFVLEVNRLHALVADQALTIGTQKDELGRLRDEAAAFVKVYETHTNQLRAKLRRVKALLPGWREASKRSGTPWGAYGDCAFELEAALKD